MLQPSAELWLVSPWITGSQWFLMDLTKGGLRPMMAAEMRAFEAVSQDQMTDDDRFKRNVFNFSLEGDYGPAAGLWQLIGGRIAS